MSHRISLGKLLLASTLALSLAIPLAQPSWAVDCPTLKADYNQLLAAAATANTAYNNAAAACDAVALPANSVSWYYDNGNNQLATHSIPVPAGYVTISSTQVTADLATLTAEKTSLNQALSPLNTRKSALVTQNTVNAAYVQQFTNQYLAGQLTLVQYNALITPYNNGIKTNNNLIANLNAQITPLQTTLTAVNAKITIDNTDITNITAWNQKVNLFQQALAAKQAASLAAFTFQQNNQQQLFDCNRPK